MRKSVKPKWKISPWSCCACDRPWRRPKATFRGPEHPLPMSERRESGIFNFPLTTPIAPPPPPPPAFCFSKPHRGKVFHNDTLTVKNFIHSAALSAARVTRRRALLRGELWTADWQRRGSCSRRKCKLLLLTRLTQHLQPPPPLLHTLHHPLPRSLAEGGSGGGGGGTILTSCCPLLVGVWNCTSLSSHLKGNKMFDNSFYLDIKCRNTQHEDEYNLGKCTIFEEHL